jgi:hypothetical protein
MKRLFMDADHHRFDSIWLGEDDLPSNFFADIKEKTDVLFN